MKKHLALSLIWLCLMSFVALGQEFRATITGRVLDQNKAAVASATVTVRNPKTNEAIAVTTNAEGGYNIPFINPGVYSITVEAVGFKKYVRDSQELQVGQTASIDVALEVGAANETVTITGDAPLLEEMKADRGNVIENRRIAELPLNARNPFMLSTLTPGITYNGPAIYQRPFDNGAIADWSVNGGQNRNNEFLLDGAPNNSIQGGNNLAYVPPVDAVGEFKIITNSFDAQYGRTSGGIVNVQIKSGGNQFHGSVYEFYRRNWLDANNVLANTKGIPKGKTLDPNTGKFVPAEHLLDQYGGQIDGPVRLPKKVFGKLGYDGRDRTFFLFNYEGYREQTPNQAVRSVPPEAFLSGDFSGYRTAPTAQFPNGQLITIYDPATGKEVPDPNKAGSTIFVRDPIQCNGRMNVICPDRINPIAAKIAAFFPKPNATTPGSDPWRNNFADIPNIANDKFKNWIFKIDQNIGEKDKVFFRYGYNNRAEIRWTNGITTGPAQDGQLPLNRINYAGVADWVHTFSPSLILNIRGSGNRYIEAARFQDGLGYDATQLGFPSSLIAQLPFKMFPRFNFSDFISYGRGSFSNEPTNVFSLQPNVSLNKAAHNLRFGLDLRYSQYARQISGNSGMQISFDRTFTQKDFSRADPLSGSAIASFLLGAPASGNVDANAFPIYMFKYYAPWIQDDWKLTRKLTINLGLRWDLNGPPVERFNRANYGFDPTAVNPASARIITSRLLNGATQVFGGLGFTDVNGAPVSPYKYDKNNIQPRIGFAYSLNDKTVLRGGFGRYYLNPTGAPGFPLNGFSITTSLVGSLDGNRTPTYALNNPFPTVATPAGAGRGLETLLGNGFSYSNPNFTVPYVHNFSFVIQRQLPWKSVVEVGYVGSRTYQGQSRYNGINEVPLSFREKCDPTKGGDPAFCNKLLPNPFQGVAGFEGTSFFTAATLTRYQLSRPFPQFNGNITELERNEGRVWYNSMQVLYNKRLTQGLTMSATYTLSKQMEEALEYPGSQDGTTAYIDDVAKIKNRSLSFSDRPQRFTISGVWELPVGKGKKFLGGSGRLVDGAIGGWELAGAYIFNSGRPWQLPGNVDFVGNQKDAILSNRERIVSGTEFIQGVKPCVAQAVKDSSQNYVRDANGNLTYALLAYSVAYGCTSPNFIIREPFTTRTTANRDPRIRRPAFEQFDLNLSKTFRINERMRFQFRAEAYNVFNTPMYDERAYNTDPNSPEFGSINKATTGQSNFPRFWQLGFKFIF